MAQPETLGSGSQEVEGEPRGNHHEREKSYQKEGEHREK